MKSLNFMKLLLLCLVLFLVQGTWAQRVILSRGQAVADIDTLVNRIVYTHPDPFTIYPESAFLERIARIKAELPDTLTDWDLAIKVIPCVVALGDGHTSVSFPQLQPSPELLLFPEGVQIDARDTSMILTGDSAKVIRINDIPAKEMLGNMVQYAGGERMFYRFLKVQQMFHGMLNRFYPDSVYRLVLADRDGKQVEKVVKALSYEQIIKMTQAKNRQKNSRDKRPDYAFQVSKDGKNMFFEFNSFYDLDKFKVFADSMFRELKERKIKNLVIDIRRNGGGNSKLGDELLQYLSHKPFVQFGKVQIRRGRYILEKFADDEDLKGASDTVFTINAPLIPLRKEPLRINKKTKVYLLISHSTFSSASSFSWAFKYFNVGTVVGEESGGMNVSYGDILTYYLPHSRLRCGVSWKKFCQYGADEQNIHGTLPDVEVPAGEALNAVKQLIRKGKK